ncbi:peptidoglycan-binding protein [Candidatus Kaiserbacteria bacterium]|nr:peptidoglycan-binding protein [Candidatus Kaiserbacteria bacterium]
MQRVSLAAGAIVASVLVIFAAAVAYAESDNSGRGNSNVPATVQALHEQIKKLKEQIEELQKKQKEAIKELRQSVVDNDDDDDDTTATSTKAERDALKAARGELRADVKEVRADLKFLRSLRRGMSGDDVRDLQELLAQFPDVYPQRLITGFFGDLTERALKKFQEKYGIESIGIFGPKTQAKVLALFVGRELPPGIIKRLGLGTSTTTPGAGFVTLCHKPVGVSPQTLVVAVPSLGAHLAHGDTVGVCPGAATTTPPTPPPADTTAPAISGVTVSGISSTTASIGWTTNELSTSKAYYGTATPLDLSTALNVSSVTAVVTHALTLAGLTASTTYSYALESSDAAGNTATTSAQSFSTTN